MSRTLPRVAWIGVGRMGAPICRNMLAAGLPLTVFDVRPHALSAIARAGARVAPSLAEAVVGADIVATMVPDDAALLDIMVGAGNLHEALAPGQLYVDFSTVSPVASARIASVLEARDVRYLRCPVSGSVSTAQSGRLAIFASGDRNGYAAMAPVFQAIGEKQHFLGAGEEARVVKLLVNMLVGLTPAILAEVLAFGEAFDLDRSMVMAAINASVVASELTRYKEDAVVRRDWSPMASIDLVIKDTDLALEIGQDRDIQMPFTRLARQIYTAARSFGTADSDFFAVTDWPEHCTILVSDSAVKRSSDAP